MPVALKCKRCRRKFSVPPSTAKRGRRYCSTKCKTADGPHNEKHGESRTRLHNIWCGMKSRCSANNKHELAQKHYVGRINVCDEWANSFESFRDWAVANGYKPGLEIDRKISTGNYEPGNCRWATRRQQMANSRRSKGPRSSSRFTGVSIAGPKWRAVITLDGRPVHLGVFDTQLSAAIAYDREAVRLRGTFARVNFPEAFKEVRHFGLNEKTQ